MQWLQDHDFNTIRLLFNHESILNDAKLGPPNEAPELADYTYLEMFSKIAQIAADHGILILMACHRLNPSSWPGNGLWYDDIVTEQRVKASWTKLARRLCSEWNVFGVDLAQEPHAASWAKGAVDSDWGHAAERLGNHVLSQCRRWMIAVEGVGYSPGARGMDSASSGIWWGENLAGARWQPVRLSDPSRLIYSPHTYGPSVYMQHYFNDARFPQNMAEIWERRFAFLALQDLAPVVIGEMGGFYTGADKVWLDWAIGYVAQHGLGLIYFALNPGSLHTAAQCTPID